MGRDSKIQWCHHTFNPWVGCAKVSEGCKHCYAEVSTTARIKRAGGLELWGQDAARYVTADSNWKQPPAWDRAAARAGERHRVFCSSLADVFEDRPDLEEPRARLWRLISDTPNLDWMLLTKRPENLPAMCPWDGMQPPPPNVWLGVTVENRAALVRIPQLLQVPAVVHFLSCEPLLEEVPIAPSLRVAALMRPADCQVNLVIGGGESGDKARPMHPQWARRLRDDCANEGVAFHFKQWGEWAPVRQVNDPGAAEMVAEHLGDFDVMALGPSGYVWQRENADGTRTTDRQPPPEAWWMARVGKKAAGRELDGVEWDEMPDQPEETRE